MKEDKDSISYCLSTVSRFESGGDGSATRYEYHPESRTVVHRGFVNERRRHDDQHGASSEEDHEEHTSDNLLVCTDVRSPKVGQLLHTSRASGEPSSGVLPSQSGPLASICWWFSPTGEQYRIQARAYVISAESERGRVAGLTAEQARRLGPRGGADFQWEAERLRVYEKLSSELKASFVGENAPGSRLVADASEKPTADLEKQLEMGDQELRAAALKHFALIVLEPVSVDLVQLKTKPHHRFSWKKTPSGDWEETELVP
ncbi:uncharacterized protein PGTG_12439 [Puccinia graminis f. sp. tritici CRL 75-36-700-3]|uniref:Pyridoxamine 5'-phosphate oxidase Alr4036 family FMN-binding domain-containing protein n=1 Tax=Puccinia graminis f. sp. tritici (strain CRL 75-36-700-3 / race SCCL) TaxID=418459 RepID=E3KQA8_PUCGT|nr:uncharacterized protein PGTG_12439 [Puccinia graminis f. sp. tritici CRL 75-36-700-3]EFP86483.1 hypothetical protein PGTG_12439 [Puccinia graminis f. sp. tritici CRL 75-36-700-3]